MAMYKRGRWQRMSRISTTTFIPFGGRRKQSFKAVAKKNFEKLWEKKPKEKNTCHNQDLREIEFNTLYQNALHLTTLFTGMHCI